MFRFICISGIALAAFFYGALAQPQADQIQRSVAVPYHDLDLSHQSGAGILLTRIERASIAACGYSPMLATPGNPAIDYLMNDYRRCRAEAIAKAVSELGAPLVTQLYAGKARPSFLAGR